MERIDKVQNLIPEKPEFVHSNQEKGEDVESLKIVNRPVVKKDAAALVTGKAVYTNDLAPSDCLIVKVVRSPYAHALIKDINTARAEAVPGIECVLTYKDCPNKRFTMAGQTYPEPSPYDRLILDQRMRFVGDAAAIVAGTSEEAVKKAIASTEVQVPEPALQPVSQTVSDSRTSCMFYKGTLRSGQVFEADGSVVVLGDVNPGGKVVAKGSVIVLGSLKGNIFAGVDGNENAFVVALEMSPMQIKIGDIIARSSDSGTKATKGRGKVKVVEPKIAYVYDQNIYIEDLEQNALDDICLD